MGKNYFRNIFWTGFFIWFVGSWIGGWNQFAETTLEGYTDSIGAILMLYGGFGHVFRGVEIHKHIEGDVFHNKELTYVDNRPGGKTQIQTDATKDTK